MGKRGHNSDFDPTAAAQLKAFIERVENLEEEKRQIGADIKDVYGKAKANGFDAKIIRKIVRLRQHEPEYLNAEREVLDVYLRALGME